MADETKVGAIKRKLLARVEEILTVGVLATDSETGETYVKAGSDKDLRLALDVVKAFHAEAGEARDVTAKELSGVLARFKERDAGAAKAN